MGVGWTKASLHPSEYISGPSLCSRTSDYIFSFNTYNNPERRAFSDLLPRRKLSLREVVLVWLETKFHIKGGNMGHWLGLYMESLGLMKSSKSNNHL